MATQKTQILIVGGGTAGITTAARLRLQAPELDVTIVEPSAWHDYQPLWTLVGAGVFPRDRARRSTASVMPHYLQNLVAVDAARRQATFEHMETKAQTTVAFDLLHVTPPQSAPDVIKQSPLASSAGWVDVDKYTLRHTRYPAVWSLGDCSSLPASRTGAAIRKQAPVLVDNLLAARHGLSLTAKYDGYASCPLVTGYGRLILAEFDYDGNPAESFPFDQAQERYSMYMLKAYGLPELYWNGMLRGRA